MEKFSWSEEAKALKPGTYQHFKGSQYEVLGVVRHNGTLEEVVVYQALYGEGDVWVKPLKIFLEDVEIEGKKVPRFKYVEVVSKRRTTQEALSSIDQEIEQLVAERELLKGLIERVLTKSIKVGVVIAGKKIGLSAAETKVGPMVFLSVEGERHTAPAMDELSSNNVELRSFLKAILNGTPVEIRVDAKRYS